MSSNAKPDTDVRYAHRIAMIFDVNGKFMRIATLNRLPVMDAFVLHNGRTFIATHMKDGVTREDDFIPWYQEVAKA